MADSSQGHTEVEGSTDRGFGAVFTAVFVIVGLWPLLDGRAPRLWGLGVAAAILLVTLLRPSLLAPFNRVWFRLGLLLHKMVSPIVMGFLFFVTVTPTALVFRVLGKDPLKRRFQPSADTYWLPRDNSRLGTMKNQF